MLASHARRRTVSTARDGPSSSSQRPAPPSRRVSTSTCTTICWRSPELRPRPRAAGNSPRSVPKHPHAGRPRRAARRTLVRPKPQATCRARRFRGNVPHRSNYLYRRIECLDHQRPDFGRQPALQDQGAVVIVKVSYLRWLAGGPPARVLPLPARADNAAPASLRGRRCRARRY